MTHPLVEANTARTVDGSKVRAPSIRSVAFAGSAPAGGTYHYDAEVRVEVVFDRSVVVDTARGSPRLALAVGARRRHAAFAASASTGKTLVFAYRVQSADMDSDGASIDANALELNGGKIKAEADSTVAANLTHDGLAADLTRKVDGRPRITGLEFYHVGPPPPRGVYGYQERIWVLAHFDQKLELEQRVHLSIEVGTDTVRLRSRAQLRMADSAVAFYYIVTRDAVDTDGVRIPKGALTLSGGSLRAASDGATNARLDHDELPADSSWRVNGRLTPVPRPFVRFRGLPTNGSTYTRHERIRIGVSYTVGVVVTGTPELTLNLGTGTRQLAAVGSTLGGPVFEYVVQTGDVDEDGVGVSVNALSLPNGATIRSAADTSVLASLTHDSLPASAVHKVDGRRVEAARVQWVSINPPPSRDSTYTRSETFYVNATFDRGVAVDTTGGRPRIALEIGDSTRYATYSHAHNSGPRYQVFMYMVQAGDRDADGFSIAANAMELNGGAITAPDDTVRADLSHGAVRPGAAYKVDGDRSGAPNVRWMWFHAPASGGHVPAQRLGRADRDVRPRHGGGHGRRAAADRSASRRLDAARDVPRSSGHMDVVPVRLRGAGGGPGRRRAQHPGERIGAERRQDHSARRHDGGGSDARLAADEPVAQGGRRPSGEQRGCCGWGSVRRRRATARTLGAKCST